MDVTIGSWTVPSKVLTEVAMEQGMVVPCACSPAAIGQATMIVDVCDMDQDKVAEFSKGYRPYMFMNKQAFENYANEFGGRDDDYIDEHGNAYEVWVWTIDGTRVVHVFPIPQQVDSLE